MKNWPKLITILTVGATLAACSNDTEETNVSPETEQEATNQADSDTTDTTESNETTDTTVDQEATYQAELDQAQAQYDADQLDEAAGTLSVLLNEDLSDYPSIKTDAESLQKEVTVAQAEQARQVAGVSSDKAGFQTERSSAVLADKYLADKGQSIKEASDDDLENWLAEQETKTPETTADSETTSEETTKPEPGKTFATDEEAEDYAFTQLIQSQQLTNEDYSYFVNKTDEQWVTIEVRESMEQDGAEWSNLIGMYRYNLEDDTIQKLNSVSGNYEAVN
ncbi:hypothetical protein [Marinilactibacillus kalidii]|uniref:hypothetical protein n=1 Tax=Marinilactibacillus kalidii TaxID=2820274 RepID=UPI001ABEE52F|nr:hypothetical protein [Marinilactibacillus kalidii]